MLRLLESLALYPTIAEAQKVDPRIRATGLNACARLATFLRRRCYILCKRVAEVQIPLRPDQHHEKGVPTAGARSNRSRLANCRTRHDGGARPRGARKIAALANRGGVARSAPLFWRLGRLLARESPFLQWGSGGGYV